MARKKAVATANRWEAWTKNDYVFSRQMLNAMAIAYDVGCTSRDTSDELTALGSNVRKYEERQRIRTAYDGEIKRRSNLNLITELDIPW